MAYDGWIEFDGIELINISRTATLAVVLGIDSVWTNPESVQWIRDALTTGEEYEDVTDAPWYDPGYPASGEFAGVVPLSLAGLSDSTLSSTPVEYITDGGHPGKPRNSTLPIVASVAIVASTEAGADYGLRWMNSVLRGSPNRYCAGSGMRYFRFASPDSPFAERRNVQLTRGSSVTRKRTTDCASTWLVTFTLTAGDPFEYGDPISAITALGNGGTSGPLVIDSGGLTYGFVECPDYDYDPAYNPLNTGLVPSPPVPDFYPDWWHLGDPSGTRFWAELAPVEPSALPLVPRVTLTAAADATIVAVSFWPRGSDITQVCGDHFNFLASYVPASGSLVVDGMDKVAYVNTGGLLRRADSFLFDTKAKPVRWRSFNDPAGFLVTMDVISIYGGHGVSAAIDFITKSD